MTLLQLFFHRKSHHPLKAEADAPPISQKCEQFTKAVEKLPPQLRTVYVMWAVQKKSRKEISAILEISSDDAFALAVKAQISVASQLREHAAFNGSCGDAEISYYRKTLKNSGFDQSAIERLIARVPRA